MKHFHGGNNSEARTEQDAETEVEPLQLEALLTLISEVGRVKLSLQDMAPQWSRRMHRQLEAAGLVGAGSPEQMNLLWQFYRSHRLLSITELPGTGGRRMSEVSERLGIPLSSATRTVEHLVQRGLLTRRADAHDRRIILVSVTELGQAVFQIFDDAFRRHLGGLLGQLTPDERAQFLHLGQRFFAIWSAAMQGDADATP